MGSTKTTTFIFWKYTRKVNERKKLIFFVLQLWFILNICSDFSFFLFTRICKSFGRKKLVFKQMNSFEEITWRFFWHSTDRYFDRNYNEIHLVLFEAARAVSKINLSLKTKRGQVKLVQILDSIYWFPDAKLDTSNSLDSLVYKRKFVDAFLKAHLKMIKV